MLINNYKFDNPVARIYQNGEFTHEIALSHDSHLTLGGNTVQVRDGKIAIVEANCPDKTCVKTGFISGIIPIICLPNRVEVQIVNCENDYDGITG